MDLGQWIGNVQVVGTQGVVYKGKVSIKGACSLGPQGNPLPIGSQATRRRLAGYTKALSLEQESVV